MRGPSTIRLIAWREISERLNSRVTWTMTALTTVLVVALIVTPAWLRRRQKPTVIGLAGSSAQALGPALQFTARALKLDIRLENLAQDADAQPRVADGSVDIALSLPANAPGPQAVVKQRFDPAVRALIEAVVNGQQQRQALAEAGVPQAVARSILRPAPLSVQMLSTLPADQAARRLAAIATALLLYVTLAIYGNAVASGVAQEKTSRIAEVLFAVVRPRQLMAGKVLGIGACGVGQLTITVIAGLIANWAVGETGMSSTLWILLPAILLWFLLGFALYSFAYAALGAMVARQEEVQFVGMPLTMVLVGGFLLTYAAIATPDSGRIRILSFVPPFAPVLMPARLALGHLAAWEMPLAALIMAGSVYGMMNVAARVYAVALIHGGARLNLREALRLGRD